MYVNHLHRGKFLQHGARRHSGSQILQALAQGHMHTVGQKCHEDVRLNTIFPLMEHRTNGQIAFEMFEGLFDLHQLQIKFP